MTANGSRFKTWACGPLVFALVCGVFWRAVANQFVDYDDTQNFLSNESYRGLGIAQLRWMFTTFHMGHYQPLAWVSLGFDYLWGSALWGKSGALDPRPYHVTNVLLHAAAAVVVFLLGLRILGSKARHAVAVLAALLFALHPMRVESVAWATERRDVLSSLLLLLTVTFYLRAHDAFATRSRWLTAALAAYTLSLLSRPIGVALPAILLVLDAWPLGRWQAARTLADRRALLLEKAPFAVLAAGFAVVAPVAARSVGASHGLDALGPIDRLAIAVHGLGFYVTKGLWPARLSPIYEIPNPFDWADPPHVASAFGVALAVALLVVGRKRFPALAAGGAVYALILLPVLGLFQVGNQAVADRYSYLPHVVLALAASAGAAAAWERAARAGWLRIALAIAACSAVVPLSIATWRQIAVWRNTESLWRHAAYAEPGSSMAQNGYGFVLFEQGQYAEADARLASAIELNPGNEHAHRNYWASLARQGKQAELIEAYRHSIRVTLEAARRQRPDLAPDDRRVRSRVLKLAECNLGATLTRLGSYDEALDHYERCVAQAPGDVASIVGLGVTQLQKGDAESAVRTLGAAVRLAPQVASHRHNLALALMRAHRTDEAIRQLREVLRLEPGHVEARRLLESLERRSTS